MRTARTPIRRRRRLHLLGGTAAVLLAVASALDSAQAATTRVPQDVPTIAAGLAAAAPGDTVELAAGVYHEHSLVLPGGVTLRSDTGSPLTVFIDGDGQGRVIDVVGGSGTAVIAGVTIMGGHVAGGFLESLGGGVRCRGGSVRLEGCRLTRNTAVIGGGFGAEQAHVELRGCLFHGNAAADTFWAGGGGAWVRDCDGFVADCNFGANTAYSTNPDRPGDAGGLFVAASRLTVSGSDFEGNETGGGAGGLYTVNDDATRIERCRIRRNSARYGGGIYIENSGGWWFDCVVEDNTADYGGGGLIGRESGALLIDCEFRGNTATVGSGGGIDSWQSWPIFESCRFEANAAATVGGGMQCGGARPRILNTVFLDNTAGVRGGALGGSYGEPRLLGCTLAGNGAPLGGGISAGQSFYATLERTLIVFSTAGGALHQTGIFAYTVLASDLYGNADGDWTEAVADLLGRDGNISGDPLFCDYAAGDLRLSPASPCAPAANGGLPIGACGVGCGLSATPPPAEAAIVMAPPAPNPFNPATTLRFTLPGDAPTRVAVHDIAGRRVRVLVDAPLPAGEHTVRWDGRDDRGRPLAAGSYLCLVTSGGLRAAARLTLVK